MIPAILPRWRLERFVDGVGLTPPSGRVNGGIRIFERRRPLKTLAHLFRDASDDLVLAGLGATAPEPVVTLEGEYGAISTLTGTHEDQPVERTIAFVVGDDSFTRIDGITAIPARFAAMRALVREVARHYRLGLGELRQRRYLYDRPAGWSGCPRGLVTEWYAPGYPADAASIAVYPARAIGEAVTGEVERALGDAEWAGFVGTGTSTALLPTAFPTGVARSFEGTRGDEARSVVVTVLQDERFSYTCRFDSSIAGRAVHAPVFQALLASIVPLPTPQRTDVPPAHDAFANWTD